MLSLRNMNVWRCLPVIFFFFFLQTQSSARSLVGSSLEGVTPQASAWLPTTSAEREHPLSCVVTPQDGWVHFVKIDSCIFKSSGRNEAVECSG